MAGGQKQGLKSAAESGKKNINLSGIKKSASTSVSKEPESEKSSAPGSFLWEEETIAMLLSFSGVR